MASEPQHPLEDMYAAREALDRATRTRGQSDIYREDWPAYGSALLSVLSSLHGLADALSDQIDQTDRDRLYRESLRDHPHEALDRAIRHLNGMNSVLATAMSQAEKYWQEAQNIHEDTRPRPGGAD